MREKDCGFSLIELMIVVAIMGVLVAIALPQYQNYQVRSKVTEALVLAESVKRAMEVYYADHGRWPVDNADAGLPHKNTLSGTYIQKTEVKTHCGHFRIKFRDDTRLGKLKGKWLWMKPTVSTDGGSIKWSCAVAGSWSVFNKAKYLLPKHCRHRANNVFKNCP